MSIVMSDAELVQRVRAGQHDVYAELVRRHQQLLYRHARGMSLDHDTSLDLVQDAFVKAYARLQECRDPAHFRSWIFRITRNLCLDHLKDVRRSAVPLSAVEHLAGDDAPDHELNAILRAALDTLPIAMREAFLLKHDAGYTYEEVAELTNATPSAVKMRVHRACEALRAFLDLQGVRAA
jgi:RNA polymerase sigma-70 factor, ECF subfamily